MTDEMKPVKCGCGGEAEVDWVLEPSNCYMANVYCNQCGTKTIPFWSTEKDKAIDYAVTTWNSAMGVDRKLDEWCTDCKEYDHEKHCCHRWNRVIKKVVDEVREKYDERTAKVINVEKPNVFKCGECGQYFHSTAWGSPVEYCSRCGCRLEWE